VSWGGLGAPQVGLSGANTKRQLGTMDGAHQTGRAMTSLSAVRPHQWMASTHAAGGHGTRAGGSAAAYAMGSEIITWGEVSGGRRGDISCWGDKGRGY
jgi:hypothetical protein